jgi:Zn-dependent protease
MFDHFSLPALVIGYVALLFSLSVHEASHAASAYWLGDDTAARLGRMTLNPLAHMDPFGTFLFPLFGMVTGIPMIGWAKPVPVSPVNFKRSINMRTGYSLVSAAGPASNVVLALIFTVVTCVAIRSMVSPHLRVGLFNAALGGYEPLGEVGLGNSVQVLLGLSGELILLNLLLAVFNLLPVGPLDGAGILSGFLPRKMADSFDRIRTQPMVYMALLLVLFSSLGGRLLGHLVDVAFFLLSPLIHILLGA